MSITIPAGCLQELGGLVDEDPPVLFSHPLPLVGAVHPLVTEGYVKRGMPKDRLLLPQSAPALLRVLARLRCLAFPAGEAPRFSVHQLGTGHNWMASLSAQNTIDIQMCGPVPASRMQALAEVVVWLARVERVWLLGWNVEARGNVMCRAGMDHEGECHTLDALEERLNLPTWSASTSALADLANVDVESKARPTEADTE